MNIPSQQSERDLDAFGRSRIERGWEPPEEVVFRTDQLDPSALQPQDIGILYHLLVRDPELPCSVLVLAEELKAYGWKGLSDKPLRESLRRLIGAGHVERLKANDPETGQMVWLFRVYRNPANNPQVKAIRSDLPDGPNKRSAHPVDSTVSAGQTHPVDLTGWAAIRSDLPDGSHDVSAGQTHPVENAGWVVSPPTPPLGGGNTTPYPHTRPAVPAGTGTREEGEDQAHVPDKHTPARLAAAADFLRGLTGDVALNSKQRTTLAPLVLEAIDGDGWCLGPELLRALSVARDSAPVKNPASVVRSRIENLRPYRASDAGTSAAAPAPDACPLHPHRPAAACRPCQAGDADGAPDPSRRVPLTGDQIAAARARVEEVQRRAAQQAARRDVKHPERREARIRRQQTAARIEAATAEEAANREKANALLGTAWQAETGHPPL
ncbi:hypothetical protein [Streptomyces laurentii]|uniref:hypothetical protein n=1 Tax=Streptomyces laurentii TaxID=39478 RepID=UPI00369B3C71